MSAVFVRFGSNPISGNCRLSPSRGWKGHFAVGVPRYVGPIGWRRWSVWLHWTVRVGKAYARAARVSHK